MRLHNISPANYCIAPEQMLLRRCRFASAFAFRTCRAFHAGPVVIEKTPSGERVYDVYSRLLKDRIIFLGHQITSECANSIVAQLLYLESVDNEKPIFMYINSPGGQVYDALAIYDTLKYISSPVHTVCVGLAASAASMLLGAGSRGNRYALKNCRIMIHQPLGGVSGQASDIAIVAQEILKIRSLLNEIYAEQTGQSLSTIEKCMERDTFLSAEEALKFGLIDKIITSRKDE